MGVEHPVAPRTARPDDTVVWACVGAVIAAAGLVFCADELAIPYWTSAHGEYLTVFVVSDGFWRELAVAAFFVGTGAVMVGAGITLCLRRLMARRRGEVFKRDSFPWALLGCGVLWLCLTSLVFSYSLGSAYELVKIYGDGRAAIVEGTVHVLHKQPWSGHEAGDRIRVNGAELEVDYYVSTSAYRQTIAHGGALTEGARARLWYHGDEILRVDMPRPGPDRDPSD